MTPYVLRLFGRSVGLSKLPLKAGSYTSMLLSEHMFLSAPKNLVALYFLWLHIPQTIYVIVYGISGVSRRCMYCCVHFLWARTKSYYLSPNPLIYKSLIPPPRLRPYFLPNSSPSHIHPSLPLASSLPKRERELPSILTFYIDTLWALIKINWDILGETVFLLHNMATMLSLHPNKNTVSSICVCTVCTNIYSGNSGVHGRAQWDVFDTSIVDRSVGWT